jgi:hypothetical protein
MRTGHDWTWVSAPASFPRLGWWACRRCGARTSTRELAARELHRTRSGVRVPKLVRGWTCKLEARSDVRTATDDAFRRAFAEVLERDGPILKALAEYDRTGRLPNDDED